MYVYSEPMEMSSSWVADMAASANFLQWWMHQVVYHQQHGFRRSIPADRGLGQQQLYEVFSRQIYSFISSAPSHSVVAEKPQCECSQVAYLELRHMWRKSFNLGFLK